MTLAEAIEAYLASASPKVIPYAHQELHRFSRAVGTDRDIEALTPPDVAAYAEGVVKAGGDIHGRLSPVKVFLAAAKKKGYSTHSLATHVKIPRATVKAVVAAARAREEIQMTEEGLLNLRGELTSLKDGREEKIEAIRLAAMDKDFRENAPLDAARETHSYAESRIKELEETLRRAVVVTKETSRERGVGVGSRVTLYDLQNERSVKYTLVDSSEADPAGGKISLVSPVGAAVLGAVVGDEVAVRAPKGERKYRVTAVES